MIDKNQNSSNLCEIGKDCKPTTQTNDNKKEKEHRNLSQDTANCDKSEDKELNLCEILDTHFGEDFFCPACGEVTLIESRCKSHFKPLYFKQNDISVHAYSNGCAYKQGLPILYPSREAYLKYPLDARKAGHEYVWLEWDRRDTPLAVFKWYERMGYQEVSFGRDCSLLKKKLI